MIDLTLQNEEYNKNPTYWRDVKNKIIYSIQKEMDELGEILNKNISEYKRKITVGKMKKLHARIQALRNPLVK